MKWSRKHSSDSDTATAVSGRQQPSAEVKGEKTYGTQTVTPATEQGSEFEASGQNKGNADAVWGDVGEGGPNYRSLGWIRAAVLETKTQIGLGVLGLPAVLDTLGFVPGMIVIIAMAVIITWTDYVIGTFKLNHPHVYSLGDVGEIFFGRVGREIWGFSYWLMLTAIAASGFLSFSIALNAVSSHGTCTVVFVAVAAIVVFLVASIQTLSKISWLGWVGLVSILSAVITLAISVGVQDRPSAAPQNGPFFKDVQTVGHPTFIDFMNAVNTVLFAYAGTPNFMPIVSEMKLTKPTDYSKSVILCQTFVTVVYCVIGGVTYHYTGKYIASPALGSAGPLLKKVCYGIAIPGLLVGSLLNSHLGSKFLFVRALGGTRHLSSNTKTHNIVWYGTVAANCVIAFVIAEAIPVFSDLLSIIGAILGTFLCIQTETFMWIYDNVRNQRTRNWYLLMAMNIIFNLIGWFIMGAGTYAAVMQIKADVGAGNKTSPFSCANNSGN
ncbi:transmembrane amino acid transporter protein-domain-containing protein [Kockovaella imperatae]|uniref:Transmembrane amino acid transporter protein-domain-containing protein n=1 Tax=Kockovaella imperatae TaxID=4999 RepID=A0A1Y1U8J3_9TREE|nr:transmembrane amino acid transporter protein-domain-containing protein [Kockovaella imperatae]ORX33435.1 transmembrane amino acid transporter protein-domain-containing protein [Kockovaella imperatae]